MAAGIFADGCGRSDEKTVGVKNRKRLSGALAFWKKAGRSSGRRRNLSIERYKAGGKWNKNEYL